MEHFGIFPFELALPKGGMEENHYYTHYVPQFVPLAISLGQKW
jgi:hypothetical protein